MPVLSLSLKEARHLHLAAQGLLKKPRRRAKPGDILQSIKQMSLLQIDTINVVARSPYLVLFSRLVPLSAALAGRGAPRRRADGVLGARSLLFTAQRLFTGASPHADAG